MGSGRPRCSWSWTWPGTQRLIRRGSIGTSARKGRSKKYTASEEQDWQTGSDRRGWGTQQHFCLSLQWHSFFPHLSSGWTSWQGLGEQSPSHYKRRSSLWPPGEPEHTQVYGTWWDASQSPEGIGYSSCQATPHDIWKVMAVRWSAWWLEKGKHCTHF